jgi:hypothetical protein
MRYLRPSPGATERQKMTSKNAQWITVALALCAAVAAQIPVLEGLVPAGVLTVVLVLTNVLSAVLPSLRASE